ncbi:MAG: hypothetical protein MR646_06280 [Agathobacter sp.]|nr:hypothetical protein [Agathobacter sp.]
MYCDNQVPAGIIADKKGCNTMVSFTESGISYHVAAGHIDEELLRRILEAIMNFSYDSDEALKLDIFNAISVVDEFY